MLNKVCLMGRLTRDPEQRYSQSENPIAITKYSLAVARAKKGETDFINIIAFGKAAEFAAQYFKKGQLVAVCGRIQTGSYTNKDGAKVYTTDIVADEQFFAESKNSQSQDSGTPYVPNNTESDVSGFEFTEIDEKNLPF